jgi:hypothetical protein
MEGKLMDLAEVRVLETNELVQTYDLTDEQDRDGVTRAIYSGLDVTQQCVIRVQRDEAMGPLTTPKPDSRTGDRATGGPVHPGPRGDGPPIRSLRSRRPIRSSMPRRRTPKPTA